MGRRGDPSFQRQHFPTAGLKWERSISWHELLRALTPCAILAGYSSSYPLHFQRIDCLPTPTPHPPTPPPFPINACALKELPFSKRVLSPTGKKGLNFRIPSQMRFPLLIVLILIDFRKRVLFSVPCMTRHEWCDAGTAPGETPRRPLASCDALVVLCTSSCGGSKEIVLHGSKIQLRCNINGAFSNKILQLKCSL